MKKIHKTLYTSLLLMLLFPFTSKAQTACDPAIAPDNLNSAYTPGSGVLLTWDAVPGSVGIRLKAVLPDGANVSKTIVGTEPNQFLVPDAALSPGVYTWQVQATCNLVPPYLTTAVSAPDTFAVGGAGTCPVSVTDIDGHSYPVVTIGSQCWMAENLQTTRYSDGSSIPGNLTGTAWSMTVFGAQALYNNDPSLLPTYGLLYNQYAAADFRGLCPLGWHIPDDSEWTALASSLGGAFAAGGAMKTVGELGAGTGLWLAPNAGASNSSGYSGVPSGYRLSSGPYGDLNGSSAYWSSTTFSLTVGWSWVLTSSSAALGHFTSAKRSGFAVRCVQD